MIMIQKIATFTLALFLISILSPVEVLAAKKRVSRGGTTAPSQKTRTQGVQSSVRLKADRRGLLLKLSGFNNITSVSYQITYTSNGVPQGVMGTVQPPFAGTEQRELLFGTCSGNVCRYHTNIRDARLVVTSKLKSGSTIRKPYRIKV